MPPAATRPPLARLLGDWVLELNGSTLRADALAGLLAAVLALPQGIAFATLAGLPPAWGINAAIVAGLVGALAGSSRHVLSGPTNAVALALAASLAPLAAMGSAEYLRLALIATLMLGVVQIAVALLRLGTLTNLISPSVLLGFTTGAAVLIAWQGTKGVLGWSMQQRLFAWPWPAPAWATLAMGAITLVLALLLRRLWPRAPWLLLALVGATLASLLPGWPASLARVGALPATVPAFELPSFTLADVKRLWPIALALTIVALGQSIALAKTLAVRSGQAIDINRECFGQGLANLAASCFHGFAGCGSLNRSLPYYDAGARTPLGAVAMALLLLLIMAFAAPAIALLPMAAIHAVLLLVAWSLLDAGAWRTIWRVDRREAGVAAGTALAMLLMPLEQAVLAGVAASFVVYLYRAAHPALRSMGFAQGAAAHAARPFVVLEDSPGAQPECPQLKLLRMEGSVWFGAASHVADSLRALRTAPGAPRHLLVMAKSMNFIDAAGAQLWEQERAARVKMGGGLYFHRPRPSVVQIWQRNGFAARLGADAVFADKRSAIAAIVPRLDAGICAGCRARIFEECAGRPGAGPA
jgi:sulfate permease, SulP family